MSTEKGYNGWTNYETWNVALWIGNDEGSYRYWEKDQAEECYRDAVERESDGDRSTWTQEAVSNLADRLSDSFEEECPKLDGCYGDMLTAALSEVNWHEIARNYVEELDRDEIEKELRPEDELDAIEASNDADSMQEAANEAEEE